MALNEQELLQSYRMLHQVFPEDLHIARPFIQMLQQSDDSRQARDLGLSMARRMLASGYSTHAISFLSLCRQLHHPDTEEIEALSNMAQFSIGNTESEPDQIFTLIEQLSDAEGVDFITQGRLMRVNNGEKIVQQGESSKTFYLILDGHVDVQIKLNGGHAITVQTLKAGDFFGEFACVYKLRRSASVIASADTLLLEFSDHAISQLMHASPMAGDYLIRTVQSRMVHAMTHSLPAFAELPEADRLWASEESTVNEFNNGDPVAVHDPALPACHILLSGSAELSLADGTSVQLETGAMFGEVSPHLLLPPQATVKAKEHTLICNMPGNIFHSFMNVYASFDHQVKMLGASLSRTIHSRG